MKNIFEISILDLMPDSMKKDPKIVAVCHAIDIELQKLSHDTKHTIHIPRIDELPESVLDLLAWQLHLDFYEPVGMDLATKRSLIKRSIADHRIKGTPESVERLFQNIFNGGRIEEWFEYGGEPYHFKIAALGRQLASEQQIKEFQHALETVKNVRSWLDGIEIRLEDLLNIYIAITSWQVSRFSARPTVKDEDNSYLTTMGFLRTEFKREIIPHQTKFELPKLHLYNGLLATSHNIEHFPADPRDMPEHDLRSTALLDLLLVGLGIVREGNPRPIEYFFEVFSTNLYLGLIASENHRQDFKNPRRFFESMNITTAGILGLNHRKEFKPSKIEHLTLEQNIFAVMHESVHEYIKDLEEYLQPTSKRTFRFLSNIFIGTARTELNRSLIKPATSSQTETQMINVAAIFTQSVLEKYFAVDQTPIEYHKTFRDIAGLFYALASNALKKFEIKNPVNLDETLHLSTTAAIHTHSNIFNFINEKNFVELNRIYIGALMHSLNLAKFKASDESDHHHQSFFEQMNFSMNFATHTLDKKVEHAEIPKDEESLMPITISIIPSTYTRIQSKSADSPSFEDHTYIENITANEYLGFIPITYSKTIFEDQFNEHDIGFLNVAGIYHTSNYFKYPASDTSGSSSSEFEFKDDLQIYVGFSNLTLTKSDIKQSEFSFSDSLNAAVSFTEIILDRKKYPALDPVENDRLDLVAGFLYSESHYEKYSFDVQDSTKTEKINLPLYQAMIPITSRQDYIKPKSDLNLIATSKPAIVSHTLHREIFNKHAPWTFEESLDLARRQRSWTNLKIVSRYRR